MVDSAPTNRLTVLLADERPDVWHENVARLLEPQGVQTILARTGREALHTLESRPVHLAVLGVQMPGLGGLQIVKIIRDNRKPAPPAILLANTLTNHLLHEALGMHVFSVLSKPVDLNTLLDSMARVLHRYHHSRWPQQDPRNG